jgi:flavorubredoxin
MKARRITDRVSLIGAVDWDRRLFDALIPIPDGTSYNAYLVFGSDRTALIDTVDPAFTEVLMAQLADVPKVDYVVAQHAEQDHSGSLAAVLDRYPKAKVVCSERCKAMLVDLLHLPDESFSPVADGDSLSLGDLTLKFLYTPWVHWPETMSTYVQQEKLLFSCDFFGSHLATTDVFAEERRVYEPAKRYFAEIMMPFRGMIQKNLDKLDGYKIKFIAPSHGPVYDKPAFIIDAYRDWVEEEPKNLAVIVYVSMHDSTRHMVDRLIDGLAAGGVGVERFDLTTIDIGRLATALVDATTVVIGTPTVLGGPHPAAATAAFLANALKPKMKFAAIVGSYGWGGKTVDQLAGLLPNVKAEFFAPVMCKGLPRAEDYEALDRLAEGIAAKHGELFGARA